MIVASKNLRNFVLEQLSQKIHMYNIHIHILYAFNLNKSNSTHKNIQTTSNYTRGHYVGLLYCALRAIKIVFVDFYKNKYFLLNSVLKYEIEMNLKMIN